MKSITKYLLFLTLFSCAAFRQTKLQHTDYTPKCDKRYKILVKTNWDMKVNGKSFMKCGGQNLKCKKQRFVFGAPAESTVENKIKKIRSNPEIYKTKLKSCIEYVYSKKDSFDYILESKVTSNEDFNFFLAMLSGATLSILPAKSEFALGMKYKLMTRKGKEIRLDNINHEVDFWINLFLLPLSFTHTLPSAGREIDEDIAKGIIKDILAFEKRN